MGHFPASHGWLPEGIYIYILDYNSMLYYIVDYMTLGCSQSKLCQWKPGHIDQFGPRRSQPRPQSWQLGGSHADCLSWDRVRVARYSGVYPLVIKHGNGKSPMNDSQVIHVWIYTWTMNLLELWSGSAVCHLNEVLIRKIMAKWPIFHCHVCLPEGTPQEWMTYFLSNLSW